MITSLALALLVASPLVYVKKETRDATREASLEATRKAMPPLVQTSWKVLNGRFTPPAGSVVNTDAEVLDPAASPPRRWSDGGHLADGQEHQLPVPTYLYRTVTVERETTGTLTFGVDNGIKVFVNGVMAHVTISTYIPPVKDLTIPLRLRAGINHVLIMVGMRGTSTKFLYRVSPVGDEVVSALDDRLDQDFPSISERSFYRIETIETPKDVALEVGGLTFVGGRRDPVLLVATRRGEIWTRRASQWRRFADGLHEPLGIWAERADEVFVVQRTEVTRLRDRDRDGVADDYEALAQPWKVSGGHHEYAFGLVRDRAGAFYVSKCALGGADSTYLGWALRIDAKGGVEPWASGLRCPNGVGMDPKLGLFITDNQGEYVATGKVFHAARGDFFGHPTSLRSNPAVRAPAGEPAIGVLDARRKEAAVLLPYGPLGQSPTQPLFDTTGGKFGPFAGQMFLGDQTTSVVMRVALEKVDGVVQGAVFPFRSGFQSGNNRVAFAPDGSLWVGQTDRGWGATGGKEFGLQRVVWTGKTPMEIHSVQLTPKGFDLTFTRPVDRAGAADPRRYSVQHFYYPYDKTYGVGQAGHTPAPPTAVTVSKDGRRVSLALPAVIGGGRIYELRAEGLRAADGDPLLHPVAYYTVNATAGRSARPHVVFVVGDHEYGSEQTMPLLAAEMERRYGMTTTVLHSRPDQDAEENIPGLEALAKADLAVFFLRWRRLPADQVAHIDRYLRSGKPVVGFRTTSHAFNYPAGHPLESWNAFGSDAFGTPPGWKKDGHTHCGHNCSTDVSVAAAAVGHPVLAGVDGPFHVRSWLYTTLPKWPPADATALLIGKAVKPDKPTIDNPVAWTRTNAHGGRSFFTTLGHPEDFRVPQVQRLVVNAMHWALGKVAPAWKGAFAVDVPYRGITPKKK